MQHDLDLETGFEGLRKKLVYTLHSQAFDWVRLNSTFYWCKNKVNKPASKLTRNDFETYYYGKPRRRPHALWFCGRVYQAVRKEHPDLHAQRCDASNSRGVREVLRTGKPSIYTCHAGITDMALPLFDGDAALGVWVMGQVLRRPPSDEHFSEVVRKLGKLAPKIDLEKLREGYHALPVVGEGELRQLLNTLTLAWEGMLERRRRTLLEKQLEPHIKRDLVNDMLAGRIGSVERILENAGILHLRGIPATAVVVELGGTPRTGTQAELTVRAAKIVERAMSSVESSVTAPVLPGRIVALVAMRTVRNRAHLRLLLREALERACRRIEAELGVAAACGVGTIQQHVGETRQSYEDAMAEVATVTLSTRRTKSKGEQDREELMQLAAKIVALFGTVTPEEYDELLRRLCLVGARVAHEDMPWVIAYSAWLIGRLAESRREHPSANAERIQNITSSALACFSRVADPLGWEKCFTEALRAFRDALTPNGTCGRDALRAEKAKAFIYANSHRKVTVGEIAAHVCISKSRLKSIFKQQTGVSCAEYLLKRRLELAQTLLAERQTSIGEIAGRLGFSCPNSFSRWFRRATRRSPYEFREGLSARFVKEVSHE